MPESLQPAAPRAQQGAHIDRRALESLQRVTDAALAYLPEEDLLQELLRRISEVLEVDTVAILLLEGDTLHARAAKGIEEEVEQGVQIPVGRGFAGRVVAQRRAIIVPDIDQFDIYNPILRQKGIRSLLGVPLLVEGRPIGVLHVGSLTPRVFTDADRDLLQLAADRAALAIEHASLFAEERRAREAAEMASRRLQAVQRVTDAALAYLPEEALLQELLRRISEILDVDTVAILLLEGETLHARAARGIEEEVEQGVRIPVGRGFAGRIVAERRAIMLPDVDHADVVNPVLRQKGIRSLLGVPLLVEGRPIGVLHVGSLTLRDFTEGDRDLLQLAADRAALAIEQARLYEQRNVAESLQRRLLSGGGIDVAGVEVATRYLPAAGASLGGDWFDIFPLPRGRIGLGVGDVVGHGVAAAAIMAQLRTALRAYAVDGHPPAATVERVNHLMWSLGPLAMTTLAYLVLDPAHETLELVIAGHPPPLVIDGSGAATYIEPESRGIALGATPTHTYRADSVPLPAGTTLLVYTDGLVERRGESIDDGLERLRAVASGTLDVDALCARVVERMVADAPTDDVAFIAAHVPPVAGHLRREWPAQPESLAGVRDLLRRWLTSHGATPDETYDIVVACQEACANAVEHAYGPGRGEFDVSARHDAGRVEIVITDRGRWRASRRDNRGRGLGMMRALVDSVDVRHDDEGTAVTIVRTLDGTA